MILVGEIELTDDGVEARQRWRRIGERPLGTRGTASRVAGLRRTTPRQQPECLSHDESCDEILADAWARLERGELEVINLTKHDSDQAARPGDTMSDLIDL